MADRKEPAAGGGWAEAGRRLKGKVESERKLRERERSLALAGAARAKTVV